MMQPRNEVADTVRARGGCPNRQASPAIDALIGDLVAVIDGTGRQTHLQCTDRSGQVAHIVAAEDIVLVTDAVRLDIVTGEQQPRNLESAGSQHKMRRSHLQAASAECTHLDGLDAIAVLAQVDCADIGMQQDVDVASGAQAMSVASAEIGRTAETLEGVAAEGVAVESRKHRTRALSQALCGGVAEIAGFAESVCLGIKRQQVGICNRPAAVRDVIAWLEIDGVKGHAPSAPDRRGTAESTLTITVRRTWLALIDDLTFVKSLRGGFRLQCAGLEQQHFDSCACELQRQAYAGCTGADDANIGAQRCGLRHIVGVDNHDSVTDSIARSAE